LVAAARVSRLFSFYQNSKRLSRYFLFAEESETYWQPIYTRFYPFRRFRGLCAMLPARLHHISARSSHRSFRSRRPHHTPAGWCTSPAAFHHSARDHSPGSTRSNITQRHVAVMGPRDGATLRRPRVPGRARRQDGAQVEAIYIDAVHFTGWCSPPCAHFAGRQGERRSPLCCASTHRRHNVALKRPKCERCATKDERRRHYSRALRFRRRPTTPFAAPSPYPRRDAPPTAPTPRATRVQRGGLAPTAPRRDQFFPYIFGMKNAEPCFLA
jgi:hypothetical protein